MRAPTSDQTTVTVDTDIEQLIYNIAEQARDEDYAQLYQGLVSRELFIPVEADSLKSVSRLSGDHLPPDGDTSIQVRTVEGPRGESFVPVVTTKNAPILAAAYVRGSWLDALSMVLDLESVAGILLQGKNSWICFYNPQIEHILKTYGNNAK